MNVPYFVGAIIVLILLVITQLVRMNGLVLKIRKHPDLTKKEIKEDTDWEFIKGLY